MTPIKLLYMVHVIEYSVFMYVSLGNLLISRGALLPLT